MKGSGYQKDLKTLAQSIIGTSGLKIISQWLKYIPELEGRRLNMSKVEEGSIWWEPTDPIEAKNFYIKSAVDFVINLTASKLKNKERSGYEN